MTSTDSNLKKTPKIPAKSIALPVEHGAWGFLFEPLAAGLLLAPSLGAPFISLMVIGAFLTRQPLKFLLGDWLQKRNLPRTAIALRFVLIFGAISTIGFIGSLLSAPAKSLLPFFAVAPIAVYLIFQDAARQSRNLLPELLASVVLSSSITALALADGWNYAPALLLWGAMLGRLIPSVLYVRSRLRLEKGKDFTRSAAISAHLLVLLAGVAGGFFLIGRAAIPTILMLAFLFARAVIGLSDYRKPATAKKVGVREVVYGAIYAFALVLGYHWLS